MMHFFVLTFTAKFQREHISGGASLQMGKKNRQFSTHQSLYLRNCARLDHSHNDGLIGSRIMCFRLVPKSSMLDDLERPICSLFKKRCVFWSSLEKF